MIDLIPIKVECHSGYKTDEFPKCFDWNNDRYEIKEILDRWYQGNSDPKQPIGNYFKVTTQDNRKFIIKHDFESDTWYLITQE